MPEQWGLESHSPGAAGLHGQGKNTMSREPAMHWLDYAFSITE
jgi:hypothetical protein